jgi:redox-sensitive bicupin YhaK (pirin superfamily)
VAPRWETVTFPAGDRTGRLVPLASGRPEHRDALPLFADGALFAGTLSAGATTTLRLDGRAAYLVPARGAVEVAGVVAEARDGMAIDGETEITLTARADCEIVLVDAGPAG